MRERPHPSDLLLSLPLPGATREERALARAVNALGTAFLRSDHADGCEPVGAPTAVIAFITHHFERAGVDAPFTRFDVPRFVDWLAEESFVHAALLPHLVPTWCALVRFLEAEGRIDELNAARVARDLRREETRVVDVLLDKFLRMAVILGLEPEAV